MDSRCSIALALICLWLLLPHAAGGPASAIRFDLKPIPFQLEHGEIAARHVPATMAGGVAVFDYNRDGRPDIFFTNGANLATLKKDDPEIPQPAVSQRRQWRLHGCHRVGGPGRHRLR